MTDREKVIKGLECCIVRKHPCGDCVYFVANPNDEDIGWCDRDKIIRNALSLLKAQEPVNPVVDIDTWKCGNCGHVIEHQQLLGDNVLLHEQYDYCPECGRAVKWNE